MKALLLKILPATNTLPSRFSVSVQGQKRFIISMESEQFDYSENSPTVLNQAVDLAITYFGFNHLKHNIGQLPNGDRVITLCEPVKLNKVEYLNKRGITVVEYYLGTDQQARERSDVVAIKQGYYKPQINEVRHYIDNDNFFNIQGVN